VQCILEHATIGCRSAHPELPSTPMHTSAERCSAHYGMGRAATLQRALVAPGSPVCAAKESRAVVGVLACRCGFRPTTSYSDPPRRTDRRKQCIR
jgi:hypothetical protein